MIDCHTHIGFGAPTKQDTKAAHGSPLGDDEIAKVREVYGWPYPPFEVPGEIVDAWRAIGRKGVAVREGWEERLAKLSAPKRAEFARVMAGEMPRKLGSAITAFKKAQSEAAPKVATRKSSEMVLEVVNAVVPETLGGSADLTGSNNTLTKGLAVFDADNRAGRYIHYGIREHGMAAAMNGIAVHGGVIPYGGTFLVFSDYARGAMRLSAVMGAGVIYVLTHDSIGLGEDGPTHQPVEHLAMLRATPKLNVFRPADTIETAEAWELALTNRDMPSVLALTRQNLATVRTRHARRNLTAQRRLCARRGRGAAAGDPHRHRLGGGDRAGRARHPAGEGHRHPRRLDAMLRSSSRRRTRSTAAACSRPGRSGWRSRPPSSSAGSAGSAASAARRRKRGSSG